MKPLLYLLCLLGPILCSCQTGTVVSERQGAVAFEADEFIGFDGFGNFFYIKNNVLFKNTSAGVLQYQNLALGNVKKVDIINPLKVVVFYEDFNAVVLLDSQMNEIQKIEFSKSETPVIASAVGMAGQNQLWVYNSLSQQIGLFDIGASQFKNLGVPIKENLLFYQTDFNYFHWVDSQNQWFSCSIFGRVTGNGPLGIYGQTQFLEQNRLLYASQNSLFLLDRNSGNRYKIEIVEKSFDKFYYKDQILSIFTPQGITNYKITIP